MWKYLPVLNVCIQVLVTVFSGWAFARFGVFDESFVHAAVCFVFFVALPSLVIRGIGINVDFYSDAFLWTYMAGFLILRVITLFVSVASVIPFHKDRTTGIGAIAVRWLTLSWISTVILGIPILTAVLDDPKKGGRYGLLAGISSFIFQLPLQLFFLECHSLEKEPLVENVDRAVQHKDIEAKEESIDSILVVKNSKAASSIAPETMDKPVAPRGDRHWYFLGTYITRRDVWTKIVLKVLHNPVLWGIALGFVISLTTLGKTYLKPGEDSEIKGLAWINTTLAWFGACVSPLSLFTMGVWMQTEGMKQLVLISPKALTLFMFSKLVLVPLVMLGLAKALKFDDETGRAAVLIAALPISLASFSLGNNYNIGEAELSANVTVGTLLMLPTLIIWNVLLDAFELFPV